MKAEEIVQVECVKAFNDRTQPDEKMYRAVGSTFKIPKQRASDLEKQGYVAIKTEEKKEK